MALIKDGRICIIIGLTTNIIFIVLKFVVFLFSHLNLYFADAVDSFVDGFVIFLVLIFLSFNLKNKLSHISMDIMLFSQWSAIIVFRAAIFLDQISDLISPEPREEPLLLIIVSSIVLVGNIIMAFLFVDEDDIVKSFLSDEERAQREARKKSHPASRFRCRIQPIFAEALDNLTTTTISLILGILLYFDILTNYLYLIDDIANMIVSAVLFGFASWRLWIISQHYTLQSSAGFELISLEKHLDDILDQPIEEHKDDKIL